MKNSEHKKSLVGPLTHLDLEIVILRARLRCGRFLPSLRIYLSALLRLRIYTNIPGLVATMGVYKLPKCPQKSPIIKSQKMLR